MHAPDPNTLGIGLRTGGPVHCGAGLVTARGPPLLNNCQLLGRTLDAAGRRRLAGLQPGSTQGCTITSESARSCCTPAPHELP